MIPRLRNPEDASRVARRINKSLAQLFTIEGDEVFISASIGISIFPLDGTDADLLMKNADLAMYYAKEKGRNGFQFFKKSLNIKATARLHFENDIRRAIASDGFWLWYQPQNDMQTGLVLPFTDWVIRQAGEQQLKWKNDGMRDMRVAVNISSKHFVEQQLPQKLRRAIDGNSLSPNFFEVEITESVMAEQRGETLEILQNLKEMGMTISVDDFGTGYSSLMYLKNFPISSIKIDRFFVQDIMTNSQDAAIVRAIVAMAQSLRMTVIAEGIETRGQFEMLRDMGCDIGQVYYFSPAIPAEEFAQLVLKDISYNDVRPSRLSVFA